MDNTLALCGTFVGTATYMSPERITSEDYSFPSDIWSLGIILYEMVTGNYPYLVTGSDFELSVHITENPAPTLDESCGYSSDLQEFSRCW